jgi:hypothetical protein
MFVLRKWKRTATAGYGKGDEREGWELRKKIVRNDKEKGKDEKKLEN